MGTKTQSSRDFKSNPSGLNEAQKHFLTCPLINKCGAAPLSYLPYEDQLNLKKQEFIDFFSKKLSDYERMASPGVDIDRCLRLIKNTKIILSPKPYYYRNRMDYTVSYKGEFGLREKGKWWKTLDGHACIIADENIRRVFELIYKKWIKNTKIPYYDRKKHTGILKYIVIRSNKNGEVLLNLIVSPSWRDNLELIKTECNKLREILENNQKLQAQQASANSFSRQPLKIAGIVLSETPLKSDRSIGQLVYTCYGQDHLLQQIHLQEYSANFKASESELNKADASSLLPIYYKVKPNAFFQNNIWVAELLVEAIIKEVKNHNPSTIYDLYSGAGFFTVALRKIFTGVPIVAVEENIEAVHSAQENIYLNFCKNNGVRREQNLPDCIGEYAGPENTNSQSPAEDKADTEAIPSSRLGRSTGEQLDPTALDCNPNIKLINQKVEDWIRQNSFGNNSIVVLDPPRSGLHPHVIKALKQNPPEIILYVSCNYKRFVEEYFDLGLGRQFSIQDIKIFDMFPNTPHVETLFVLRRRGA